AAIPAGCTWLLPERDDDGRVVDFRIAAASGDDLHGRGVGRVGELLSVLYPTVVGGDLWQLYSHVLIPVYRASSPTSTTARRSPASWPSRISRSASTRCSTGCWSGG